MRPRRPTVAVWAFLLVASAACGARERLDASPRRRPALTTTSATEAATATSPPIETTTSTIKSPPPREAPTTTATSRVSTTTAKTVAPVVWRAQEGGLAVEARLDPREPRPGETVRVTVHATDTSGGSIAAGLDWGDGHPYGMPSAPMPLCTMAPVDAGSPQPKPEPPEEKPSVADMVFDHAFPQDGTYTLYLFVRSDHVACGDDRPGVSLDIRGTVVVVG